MKHDRLITMNKIKFLIVPVGLVLFLGGTALGKFNQKLNAAEQTNAPISKGLKEALDKSFLQGNEWPLEVSLNNKPLKIEYTFNDKLTLYIRELLKQYRQSKKMVKMFKGSKGDMSKFMKKFGGRLPMGG